MRDARPFQPDLLIHDKIWAEVILHKLAVQRAEGSRAQRFAAFPHRVGLAFKLGKHCLAVNGALKVFKILVEQHEPGRGVLLFFEKLLDHEVFVDGGGNFRHKQRVAGVLRRLGTVGQQTVHAVAHFMRDGRNAVQRAGEVGQDIGLGIVGAGGISAATFAFVGINVNPALGKAAADFGAVRFAKRGHRLQHHLPGLLVGIAGGAFTGQRGVDIIIMQFVQPKQPFAQRDIAVHGRQMGPNRGDKVVVYLFGNVLPRH